MAGAPAALALFCSHDFVHLIACVIARVALPAVAPPSSDYVHIRREGKTPQPPVVSYRKWPAALTGAPPMRRAAGEVPEWSIGTVSKTVVRA